MAVLFPFIISNLLIWLFNLNTELLLPVNVKSAFPFMLTSTVGFQSRACILNPISFKKKILIFLLNFI